MSAGKNPYYRFHIINECLSSKHKRYWSMRELIEKLREMDFDVAVRTVKLDLEYMRYDKRLGFRAPIKYSKSQKGYYYADPDYTINNVSLTDGQLHILDSVVEMLQMYEGSGIVKEFEGAIHKIVRGVDQLRRDKQKKKEQTIAFERAPYYKGMVWFDKVKTGLDQKQPLSITYKKFTASKPDVHVFHPYFMKEFKGRWYVLGYSEQRSNVIILALDRIESIEPEKVRYKPNTYLNAHEYFRNTIGVTHTKKPVENIVLWFSPGMANYIKTQHLHNSQEIVRDDAEGLIIRLRLIINYELIAMLLGYCPDVSVIAPMKLKSKLEELLMKGVEVNRKKFKDIG